jgi:hypothetical protein
MEIVNITACKYRTSNKFIYRLALFLYHDVKITVTLMTDMALTLNSTQKVRQRFKNLLSGILK